MASSLWAALTVSRSRSAPTGTVVVKLTPDATEADRQRLAGLAAAPATPRLHAELLARAAAKSRRAPAAIGSKA